MSDEQPYNAADPRQVKKRADKAKKAAERNDDDLAKLLGQPEFRRFVWSLICERCQIFQSPFNPNGSTQSVNIGRQGVGLELLAEIERVDARLVPQMMIEYAEAKARD